MNKILNELNRIEKLLFNVTSLQFSNLIEDKESKEYLGCSFKLGKLNIKFRKAKITPKKNGQFVTLWKRNFENKPEPYKESAIYDFYIIFTEDKENYGCFIFSKNELIKQKIISSKVGEGKRGFRVYPNWVNTENDQARKTQIWQSYYFFNAPIEIEEVKKYLFEI